MSEERPFGSWPSPLTARWATAASPRLDGAAFAAGDVWWGESLAEEKGRSAVLRRAGDGSSDVALPEPWSARSGVHGYGGGAWTVAEDETLFFVEKTDGRIWSLTPGGTPRALTPEGDGAYGGLRQCGDRLLAIRERASERALVMIDATGVHDLVSGPGFFAHPALSPNGDRLAWIEWAHPAMPWDRTTLYLATLEGDGLGERIALTSGSTSALQPEWLDNETLLYLDDPDGRWNIWRRSVAEQTALNIALADADTGGGLWVLDMRWYAPLEGGRILAVRTNGSDELVIIGEDHIARTLDVPFSARMHIADVSGAEALVFGSGDGVSGLWRVDLDAGTAERVAGGAWDIDDALIPRAERITVDGPHGPVHAYVYAPTNPHWHGPEGETPPFLVTVHGGPTDNAPSVADTKVAYLTSRGIGVLDVDYGGSTGYGRAYRERLLGQWGVVDVDDVVAAARGLVDRHLADPGRLAIEGGSAGGWTVLSALTRTDVFAAGISRYGVGDARALVDAAPDFESRYLDGLIGPLPEDEAVYIERSPLTHADRFTAPVLLLHGSEDPVVPPAQSEAIRDALAARGIPHLYRLYEGEGHGFRSPDTVVDVLESKLAFLGQVLGFDTPGVDPLTLD